MNSDDITPTEAAQALSVLVVDGDVAIQELLAKVLGEEGYTVDAANDLAGALERMAATTYDILVVDKDLPDGPGLDIARHVATGDLECETVIISAHGTLESTMEAMRLGVADCWPKPFDDIDLIRTCLQRVRRTYALKQQNRRLSAELSEKNQILEGVSTRDPATQLFNHAVFHEQLELDLRRSARHGLPSALLMIDIDNFSQINDALGHEVGDRLLRCLADILRGKSGMPHPDFTPRQLDVAARYGSDEFALLLPELAQADALKRAERIKATVEKFDFDAHDLPTPTLSMGYAMFPDDASNRNALLDAADLALYTAKRGGRGRVVAYQDSLPQRSGRSRRVSLAEARQLEALERSILHIDFDYVYQPIVDAKTGHPRAYEALVRPRDPAFPNPPALIQAAERAGQLRELGRALREAAIPAIESLPDDVLLFVNLHPDEVYDPELLAPRPFLAPWTDRIVFEITEVARITDYARLRKVLDQLRQIGYRVAIDDLGAGYSGLNSLAMLEPDYVKLDMQLIRAIERDKRTARLVQHIIEFANDEGMTAIAEGIETESERNIVTQMGCPLLQGYFFSKPKPLDAILDA